jgi:hypothetical protein
MNSRRLIRCPRKYPNGAGYQFLHAGVMVVLQCSVRRLKWVIFPRSADRLVTVNVTLFSDVPGYRPVRGKGARNRLEHMQQRFQASQYALLPVNCELSRICLPEPRGDA